MSDDVIEEIVEEVIEVAEGKEVVIEEPVVIPESGHLNKEQWEAAGNDPDRWVGEDVYKDRGHNTKKIDKLKTQVSDMQAEMNQRLEQQRVFMEVQHNQKIEELESQRAIAVSEADTDQFNKVQKQIESINKQTVYAPPAPVTPEVIQKWNEDNPWVKGNSAKAQYARNQYVGYGNSGYTEAQALEAMQGDLAREFPDINPNVRGAAAVEGGSSPGKKITKKVYSIKNVTNDEMKMREFFVGMSDADFARTVIDSRGEG